MARPVIKPLPVDPSQDAARCLGLWAAVLQCAVRDLTALTRHINKKPGVIDDPLFHHDHRTLVRWFTSPSVGVGSFNWICFTLDISPSRARRKLGQQLGIDLGASPPRQMVA